MNQISTRNVSNQSPPSVHPLGSASLHSVQKFIKWAPATATVRQNVLYSTQAKHVMSYFNGVKEIGAGNFDDLAKEIGIVDSESEEEEWDPDA